MKYIDYNENKQHGSADFPVAHYFVTHQHLQYHMPLHWHRELEVMRVVSGRFELYVDNVRYELKAGDTAFIDCCALHRGTPTDCTYECLVFDLNMLRKKAPAMDTYLSPIFHRTVTVSGVHRLQNDALDATVCALFTALAEEHPHYRLTVFSLLYRLFFDLYEQGYVRQNSTPVKDRHQRQSMTELFDWIDRHYAEHITLADLARTSGFSEKYLCRLFKEYTAKTPMEYINRLRIESACHDILYTGASITDAAFNNGFNNLNYFSKTFKNQIGLSPREYKKRFATG